MEEEINPKTLLNAPAAGGDAGIQHPDVSNPTGTPLRRWAAPNSVALQLKNAELLPNLDEENNPAKLPNPPAAGGYASIQHPYVSNPTGTPLRPRAAPNSVVF